LGLATDYCVKFTALDGRRLGFEVSLVAEGCRGVELRAGDVAKAVEEMRGAGVRVV
jgi:nicotinamidase/pyrazinamidase